MSRISMDPVVVVTELPNRTYHATSSDNDLLIQIATAGGTIQGLRGVIASNDHASDRAYIQSPGSTTGRGICLVAGDSVLLVGINSGIRYQGQISCGLIY